MSSDKHPLDHHFLKAVRAQHFPKPIAKTRASDVGLDKTTFLDLFDTQLISRHLDFVARDLRADNKGFYTIGSSGHEAMASVGKVFHVSDMAFLHYRSAGFFIQRAKMKPEINIIRDLLLSLLASRDDPASGGHHKVFGSVPLNIPPQTSTVASHLPKAVGAAASIERARRLGIERNLPDDSVVVCCFGDGSINHASALAAFNTAQWVTQGNYPLPIVFICEDNGLGISVRTPKHWVRNTMNHQPYLHYIAADGFQLADTFHAAKEAEFFARVKRRPVFLHIHCERLMGHAGSDHELHYRTDAEIAHDEDNDPLLHSARDLIAQYALSPDDVIELYENVRTKIQTELDCMLPTQCLTTADEVMSSIIPPKRDIDLPPLPDDKTRKKVFGKKYAKLKKKNHLALNINLALTDIMLQYKNTMVFGEDVAKKGGIYRVTADLLEVFRPARVFNSLLDETSILGYAMGHAHNGFIPIPEIQFLSFLHTAEDQLRGEAATLPFFSNGQFANSMVIRIPGFAYQKGIGGHFHNDNSIAVLRDIPGIVIACPSTPTSAVLLLRRCMQLAYQEQRVVVFLEPIALYMQKDCHQEGDKLWLGEYPEQSKVATFNEPVISGESEDVAIITYGNGHFLSQQAAKNLHDMHQLPIKIIDLQWLAPLNEEVIIQAVSNVKHVVIVDECRKTGSLSEQLVAVLVARDYKGSIDCITGEDSFIPLGDAAACVLPSRDKIIKKILQRTHLPPLP